MSSLTRRDFLKTAGAAVLAAPFVGRSAERQGFDIGLVADAQYADIADKGTRFYRKSPGRLTEAVEHFNGRELEFCAHLGDLIDRDWKSFDEITKPFATSRQRWYHLLGNHDFEVLDELKPRVPERIGLKQRHYFFDVRDVRFVVLDTNEVSTYAHPVGTPEQAAGAAQLKRLEAAKAPQAKSWNGSVAPAQLAWFEQGCASARAIGHKVIVLAHHPVAPDLEHNAWNATELLAIVERQRNVVAWLNGHNHAGNFAEVSGVPFVTMHGMVETADTTAFATARILADRMIIAGHGREPSRELVFRRS